MSSHKKDINAIIPFPITLKRPKYLEISLTRETKDVYNENYRMLPEEIKGDRINLKDIPHSWIGRLTIVNMLIPLKVIYRFPNLGHLRVI